MLINILLVASGAACGALSRLLLSNWIKRSWPTSFPIATFLINITGSLLLGLLIGSGANNHLQLLIGTGFMGSFTTFSTFKLENIELHLKQQYKILFSYLGLSYVVGIGLAGLGLWIGQHFIH